MKIEETQVQRNLRDDDPFGIVRPERIEQLLDDKDFLARRALDELLLEISSLKGKGVNVERLESLASLFYTYSKAALYKSLRTGDSGWNVLEIHIADKIGADKIARGL